MKLKIQVPKIRRANAPLSRRQAFLRLRKGYLTKKNKTEGPKEAAAVYFPWERGPPGVAGGQNIETAEEKELKIIEAKESEGIEVSAEVRPGSPIKVSSITNEKLIGTNIYYPLNPRKPKQGEPIFAYANIKWESKINELIYYIIEPKITASEKTILESIKLELEERLDIDFTNIGLVKAKELLRKEAEAIIAKSNISLENRKNMLYYIERDIIGFGKADALMKDPNIEDISCDGRNISLYAYHRNPKFGSTRTNVRFKTNDELNDFIIRFAQKCGKTISVAEPLMDASLPDGSRVQATLGTDIARRGSNFTIRKFTEDPLTPVHMLKYGTLDSTQLAYLWLAVENGQSILISGATATGKTSLLNVVSLFIRPSQKVVSIEDTAELRLPLPHWIPEVARSPLSIKGRKGEVTLFDLLKSSLRQRPDYIIVGEVRGREAFVLFQQMATGHAALSTIHAASIPQLVDRLITPPISLPPNLLENIDIILFLTLSKLKGRYVRRVDDILEVVGMDKGKIITKNIFKWRPIDDNFEVVKKSGTLKKLAERLGITEDTIRQELVNRKKILEWMLEQEMYEYREVSKVINAYYTNPENLIERIMG
ncbi:MAG: type II/IV secretion system ATPase subunit [Candidatus Aenigmarchaeota archaeon]|nr:type II/IV secretion system ATPase subunit [Candidatus Aenigmarchaeota archaeon]